MTHTESSIVAADGTRLFFQSWHPAVAPRATAVIQHGFSEHGGRYAAFAGQLTGRGITAYALDLRGHGRSGGKCAYVDRFEQYVDDFDGFVQEVGKRHPDLPVFALGHSMGGAVAAVWAAAHQPDVAGLILCSAAVVIRADAPRWLLAIARPLSRLLPHLPTVRLKDPSILSQDERVLAARAQDPLVFKGRVPARGGAEVLRGGDLAFGMLEKIACPLLILHGEADVLTEPAGSRAVYARAASPDKTLMLYEGQRHELLNEPESPRVVRDICAWIEMRCSRTQ